MTHSEANVTSDPSGSESPVVRESAGEAGASALAAWRTSFESSALPGFGRVTTLAAMGCVTPLCASLSLSAAQLRSTSPARASVRGPGGVLPAPRHAPRRSRQPISTAHHLPQGGARLLFSRAVSRPRANAGASNATPNHALQRTAPRVTLAAADHPATSAHPAARRLRPQPARRAPQSLSLGSLGVATVS